MTPDERALLLAVAARLATAEVKDAGTSSLVSRLRYPDLVPLMRTVEKAQP